jgi:hypothetical protein
MSYKLALGFGSFLLGLTFYCGYRVGYDNKINDNNNQTERKACQDSLVDLIMENAKCEIKLYRMENHESCPEPIDYCEGEEKY